MSLPLNLHRFAVEGSTTVVRGVAGELEAENWRLCSTTLVRGAICEAGS